jgi:hypothetical protein
MVMRKVILLFALMTGLYSLVFAEHEVWFSVGHERAFLMDTYMVFGEAVDTNTSSSGVNLSTYRFFGDNMGMFTHSSFLFPQRGWEWSDDGVYGLDFSDVSLNVQWGILLGIAFKYSVSTDDLHFYYGVGLNIFFSYLIAGVSGTAASGDIHSTSFGIGSDLGLKFDITDRFFIKLGSIINFDFLRFSSIDIYNGRVHIENITGRDREFFMLGVRPYIVGGVNLHWKTVNRRQRLETGKPK